MTLVKRLLIWGIIGCIVCILFCEQARFYPDSFKQSILSSEFHRHCQDLKIDENDYEGPYKTQVGTTIYSCEWRTRSHQQKYEIIGAWLKSDGESKLYFGPWGM
jgi:hypothetical protein